MLLIDHRSDRQKLLRSGLAGCSLSMLLATASIPAVAADTDRVGQLQQQIDRLQEELGHLGDKVEEQESRPADQRILGPREMQSGLDQVRLTISGQVNRGVLITDDNEDTDVFFVDNDNSSTRVRLLGDADLNEDISAGTVIEVQFESNSTADVSQDNERNAGDNNFTERKLELFVDSKTYGRVWLGQGDTASNGTSERDESGVAVVGYSAVQDLAGGIQFRDDDGNLSGVDIGDTFDNFDGLSRDDRVLYDTPSFEGRVPALEGVKLSASAVADDRQDVAVSYSRQLFDQHNFAAAISYANASGDFEQINGSASVLLGGQLEGVNLTFAAGSRDFDETGRDTGTFWYGKLGYLFSAWSIGKTGLAIDYYEGDDVGADGDEATSVGLLAVQNITQIGMELYAGGRNYELDRNGEDFDDIQALLVGARVKF